MKFEALAPVMNERMTRLWAAAEAEAYGRGGAAAAPSCFSREVHPTTSW